MKIELTPIEKELLALFRQLSPEEKAIVLSMQPKPASVQGTSAFLGQKAV